ncbi:MAG: toxin YdaT family protein [Moraxellaceae bacterium]
MRNTVTRQQSHNTLISTVLGHVNAWRRDARLSRESVVQLIVEAHERVGGHTEIHFDQGPSDAFQRMKNAADRVFRWLDDQTKDTNFLPANFLPSILAAMPLEVRCACVNELLEQTGLAAHVPADADSAHLDPIDALRRVLKEGGDVEQALAGLLDGYDEAELLEAQRQIAEAEQAIKEARTMVEIKLSRLRMIAN